ncbi:MAG: AAA family ATPase [Candidatus ainarchaeum sp.]|nr:AAA family ATPase [Candidatus ainarchaeum sp.]MDD5096529.1 AAA family ATPase [Candidatus ainarchaeum sp.]
MNVFRGLEGIRGKGVFRNEDAFNPEFLPEQVIGRGKEVRELAFNLKPVSEKRRPTSMVLYGPPGTGKTCCTRHVLKELTEYTQRAEPIYINCWRHSTRTAILSVILEKFDMINPRRGISSEEVLHRAVELIRKSGKTPIIVLDEADALIDGEESGVFYDLLRMGETEKLNVGVVAITNREDILSLLDRRIRSSLMQADVEFKRYTPGELKEILKDRAKAGLVPGSWDEEALGVCAAFAGKNGGDARIAITLLWLAGRRAEAGSGRITVKEVEESKNRVLQEIKEKREELLDEEDKALMEFIKKKGRATSGEIYAAFRGSERAWREHLGKLESMGLLESEYLREEGKKGRTRVFRAKL